MSSSYITPAIVTTQPNIIILPVNAVVGIPNSPGNGGGGSGGSSQDSITGNGTSNTPFQLVNDNASPGNSMVYGTGASGVKGWLTQASLVVNWSSIAGAPAFVPNSVQVGTADSLTGGGALTGNLTLTLVNDSASPGNSMLYGTNGAGVRGWYAQAAPGGGTNTYGKFNAMSAKYPTSNAASFDTLANGVPVIDFAQGVASGAFFVDVMPQGAVLTGSLIVNIYWRSSVNTGAVVWEAAIENSSASGTGDNFGTQVLVTATVVGTAGNMNLTQITLPNADLQSLAAEQVYRLQIQRLGANTGDTMAATAQVQAVIIGVN